MAARVLLESGETTMRIPTYLSNSSFQLFEKNREDFYLKYLSDNKPPRIPQERPASVGSCFDALVKSSLCHDLGIKDPKNTFEALFEAQVEPHNRDWVLEEGRYVFDCYKVSGFYGSLLEEVAQSREPPRFEFEVRANINGVDFLGKPDAKWASPKRIEVVHDWKVNGYCSKSATSPCKAYQLCCDGFVADKQNKSHNTAHKEYLAYQHGDMTINEAYLESAKDEWADQLSLYGWALGENVADENVVLSIHQIVAKPIPNAKPQLRVAQYRARVKASYQLKLAQRLKACWDAIQSGHIFTDMSREDSDARCAALDDAAKGLQSDGSSTEEFFNMATRGQYRG
jgi:hypothetical protein